MTDSAYLTRIRLSPATGPGRVISALKKSQDMADPTALGHHLVWTLFPDMPDANRPFIYRDEGDGTYIVMSKNIAPRNDDGLFIMDGPKTFAPAIHKDDMLRFRLRANPVRRVRDERLRTNDDGTPKLDSKGRTQRVSKKVDTVMARLRDIPRTGTDRTQQRPLIVQQAGREWIARTGVDGGFMANPESLMVDHYRKQRLWRGGKKEPQSFTTLDFEGILKVTEPEKFLDRLTTGFGSAKAFGCGLMLIRRA